jgi:hypothetical protein
MDNNNPGGSESGTPVMSPAVKEKYGLLSARYGNDFYGYIGYVLLERGREGWLRLIEGVPIETVDAAVSTWIASGRPAGTPVSNSKGTTAGW